MTNIKTRQDVIWGIARPNNAERHPQCLSWDFEKLLPKHAFRLAQISSWELISIYCTALIINWRARRYNSIKAWLTIAQCYVANCDRKQVNSSSPEKKRSTVLLMLLAIKWPNHHEKSCTLDHIYVYQGLFIKLFIYLFKTKIVWYFSKFVVEN